MRGGSEARAAKERAGGARTTAVWIALAAISTVLVFAAGLTTTARAQAPVTPPEGTLERPVPPGEGTLERLVAPPEGTLERPTPPPEGTLERPAAAGIRGPFPSVLGVPVTLGQLVNRLIQLAIFGGGVLLVWIIIRTAWGMLRGTNTKPEDLKKAWTTVLYAALGYLAILVAWSVPRLIASFLTGG